MGRQTLFSTISKTNVARRARGAFSPEARPSVRTGFFFFFFIPRSHCGHHLRRCVWFSLATGGGNTGE